MQVGTDVLNVLSNAVINENALILTGTLDRKLYVATNKVLEAAGGKWSRKAQAHVFEGDAADLMDSIILTGTVTDRKQELGYFPTPQPVVALLLEQADIEAGNLVLEPSAGQGAIAVAVAKLGAIVHCFEIDPTNSDKLATALFAVAPEYSVSTRDFLTVERPQANFRGDLYDRVVMNPPFAKQQDIKHVLHAFEFLNPGGRLVSVMSAGVSFRTNKLTEDFRQFVDAHDGDIAPLPADSFVESGTGVSTVIVTMNK